MSATLDGGAEPPAGPRGPSHRRTAGPQRADDDYGDLHGVSDLLIRRVFDWPLGSEGDR